jgi:MFS transporter, SP family, arabinose:H+ symporter
MNNRIYLWSIVAALAGFLFGFDTVVISGAEKNIQALWNLPGWLHGFVMASALYGTVIGSIIGAWPTDKWGRKKTLIWIGVFYFVSAVWSGLATDAWTLSIARFIGGLGVGVSTITAPLFISEISPPDRRGRLTGMFQFNIVFGILVAFGSNFFIEKSAGENAWRWMLGVEAVPALLYTICCFSLPESPRWLIGQGRREEGAAVLRAISPGADEATISRQGNEIAAAATQSAANTTGFFSGNVRLPVLLAFIIAAFNQLSGINVILYFAPRLLGLAGIENPVLASVWIGIVNLAFTFIGLWLIDRLGRKTLLTIGSFGYIFSLGVCAWAFLSFSEFKTVSKSIDLADKAERVAKIEKGVLKLQPEDVAAAQRELADAKTAYLAAVPTASLTAEATQIAETAQLSKKQAAEALGGKSMIVLVCILLFIAAHAIGQGAVIWVFISEIFPAKFRGAGQALGSATHWVFAAGLTQLFPIAIAKFEAGYHFAFFCAMMVLQLIWVKTMVKETKGRSLEDIEQEFARKQSV